jgi:tRNA threonylcarbamoyladenosine biosynthesis protein TsaB
MALVLSIDTATPVCSVALHLQSQLLGYAETVGDKSHSRNLTLLIQQVLSLSGYTLAQLDAVAVGKGPGSYTGLRIGVSTAKGICFALDKPLIGVPTLECMALQVQDYLTDPQLLFCPMLDARRMEVYCALYRQSLETVLPVSAVIVAEGSFSEQLTGHKVVFFGNGAPKCRSLLEKHPNAQFAEGVYPSARYTGKLAWYRFKKQQFEDLAYFEPFYLKEFIATRPSKGSSPNLEHGNTN